MKKFKLNPQEELLASAIYNPVYQERRKARFDLYFIALMIIAGGFFYYVMQTSIPAFLILVLMCALAGVIALIHYIYVIVQAGKHKGEEKYYVTTSRVVVADQDDVVLKEVLSGKIKKCEIERISGNCGTIYINKREDTRRKAQIKKFRTQQIVYTSDTIILKSIQDSNEVYNKIKEIMA